MHFANCDRSPGAQFVLLPVPDSCGARLAGSSLLPVRGFCG
jgi:hypothetical protein